MHFLLQETSDILRLSPLPLLYVRPGTVPAAHLLRVPAATVLAAGSVPSPRSFSWQRQPLLLLSSGALQLPAAQLQALLAAALAPMACPGAC